MISRGKRSTDFVSKQDKLAKLRGCSAANKSSAPSMGADSSLGQRGSCSFGCRENKGYEAQTKQLLKTIGFDDILTDRKKPESADMDDDIEVARAMLEQTKAAKQSGRSGDLSKPDALPGGRNLYCFSINAFIRRRHGVLVSDFRAVIVDLVNSQYSAKDKRAKTSVMVSPDLTERTVDEVDVADDQGITQETDTITETLRDRFKKNRCHYIICNS